jgi:hypothetical protein
MAETHKREIQHTTKTTTKDGHFVRPTTLTPRHAYKVLEAKATNHHQNQKQRPVREPAYEKNNYFRIFNLLIRFKYR